jgi:hypothetical protein
LGSLILDFLEHFVPLMRKLILIHEFIFSLKQHDTNIVLVINAFLSLFFVISGVMIVF